MSSQTTQYQSTSGFRLKDAELHGPMGTLLAFPELIFADQGITVVFGPAGTGKSLLLRALSGSPLPGGWTALGQWRFGDEKLSEQSEPDIAWLPQQKRDERDFRIDGKLAKYQNWQEVLASGSTMMLLDEPDRGLDKAGLQDLILALKRHAHRGAGIVVTHNQQFARAIGDEIVLLSDGKIAGAGATEAFFEHPPTPLVEQFIRTGNCGSAKPIPPLPPHFHWIIEGQLAGMGKPGLLGELDEDLTAIGMAGINHLVTLTKEVFPTDTLRSFGLTGRHFPITDMSVPSTGATATLCAAVSRQIKQGQGVALHCHAGLGRTGTILACILVWDGMSPEEAVKKVRSVGKGYIQNEAQLKFVSRFAEVV